VIVVVLLVVAAVLALLAGAHWYVWRRLVRDTMPGRRARRVGAVVLTVLPLLSVAALVARRAGVPFRAEQVIAWPGFMWLALLLYLVLFLLAGEVVRAVWLRFGRSSDASGGGTERGGPGPAADPAPGGASPAGVTVLRETGIARESARPTPAPAPGPAPTPGPAPAPGASAASAAGAVAGSGRAARAGTGSASAPTPAGATATAPPGTGTPEELPDPSATAPDPAGGRTEAPEPAAPSPAVTRRLFVSRVVGGGAAAAALTTVGLGTYGVLNGPSVKRVTVPLAKLPRAAHGYRIAVVSDIHLGPILGRAHTRRIVDAINSTGPDLVAIVGDMVDGDVADLGPAAEPLTGLRARHGSFFVTGNHEYFSGADQWVEHVRELGLRPLQNERIELPGGFDLAGVDDVEGEREGKGPDFVKALGDRDRGRAAVLLAHQPVVIHDAVEHGVDLQLSGHTHGGQLWPGRFLAAIPNPTVSGLERYGDTQLYVTKGAGAWGPPVRVGAESDITVVQLASLRA
jgi:uncharacterized protein